MTLSRHWTSSRQCLDTGQALDSVSTLDKLFLGTDFDTSLCNYHIFLSLLVAVQHVLVALDRKTEEYRNWNYRRRRLVAGVDLLVGTITGERVLLSQRRRRDVAGPPAVISLLLPDVAARLGTLRLTRPTRVRRRR